MTPRTWHPATDTRRFSEFPKPPPEHITSPVELNAMGDAWRAGPGEYWTYSAAFRHAWNEAKSFYMAHPELLQ